jgi:hypothetical protein
MSNFRRNQITRNSQLDLLHSINARVNRALRDIEAGLPINLEDLNDIRVATAKIELLDKDSKNK